MPSRSHAASTAQLVIRGTAIRCKFRNLLKLHTVSSGRLFGSTQVNRFSWPLREHINFLSNNHTLALEEGRRTAPSQYGFEIISRLGCKHLGTQWVYVPRVERQLL